MPGDETQDGGRNISSSTHRIHNITTINQVTKPELLLTGRIQGVWRGPSLSQFKRNVLENIILKHCDTEENKIAQAQSQISNDQNSEIRQLIDASPETFTKRTLDDFFAALETLIFPDKPLTLIDAMSRILNFKWNESKNLAAATFTLNTLYNELLQAFLSKHSEAQISEEFIHMMTFTHIHHLLPSSYKNEYEKLYDSNLPQTLQIKQFLHKSQGRLNDPHRNPAAIASVNYSQQANNDSYKRYTAPHQQHNKDSFQRNFQRNNFVQTQPRPQQKPHQLQHQQQRPQQQQNRPLACWHCERFEHGTKECPFNAFCSLCHQPHRRGTTQRCHGSKWIPDYKNFQVRSRPITEDIKKAIRNNIWKGTGITRPNYTGTRPSANPASFRQNFERPRNGTYQNHTPNNGARRKHPPSHVRMTYAHPNEEDDMQDAQQVFYDDGTDNFYEEDDQNSQQHFL